LEVTNVLDRSNVVPREIKNPELREGVEVLHLVDVVGVQVEDVELVESI